MYFCVCVCRIMSTCAVKFAVTTVAPAPIRGQLPGPVIAQWGGQDYIVMSPTCLASTLRPEKVSIRIRIRNTFLIPCGKFLKFP